MLAMNEQKKIQCVAQGEDICNSHFHSDAVNSFICNSIASCSLPT